MIIGGQAHTDINGVEYIADPLRSGVASDYGSRLNILRVDPHDAILYQTERYWSVFPEVLRRSLSLNWDEAETLSYLRFRLLHERHRFAAVTSMKSHVTKKVP